jgi:hypothetical protein
MPQTVRGTPKGRGAGGKSSRWDWASPPVMASSATGRGSGKRAALSGSPATNAQPTASSDRGRQGWGKAGGGVGGDGGGSGDEAAQDPGVDGRGSGSPDDDPEGGLFCAVVSSEGRTQTGYKLLELEEGPSPFSDTGSKGGGRGGSESIALNARQWKSLPTEEGCDSSGDRSL